MTLTLRYSAISDRGLIRSGNQDSVYAGPRLIAVADGMGGMAAGDLASATVIETIARLDDSTAHGEPTALLASAVDEANDRLRDMVDANPQMEGMGTTLTAFLFSDAKLGMVHIGDSRAYRLRHGGLSQVTKDDTYVQMLVDEGRISAEEAASHPQRSLLLRALGAAEVTPSYTLMDVEPGDRFLLCSDGLSGVVSHETITEVLNAAAEPAEACDKLVQLALRGGAPDNVTVLVADVAENGGPSGPPIIAGAAAGESQPSAADPTTAAARAAVTTGVAGLAADDGAQGALVAEPDADSRRGRRIGLITLAVGLLLVLALAGGYMYWQSQYFVGIDDDGNVAVFQGVSGDVAGMDLSRLEISSGRDADDLTEQARAKLDDGIVADDRDDAVRILEEITADNPNNSNLLPMCDSISDNPGTGDDTTDGPTGSAPQTDTDCRIG